MKRRNKILIGVLILIALVSMFYIGKYTENLRNLDSGIIHGKGSDSSIYIGDGEDEFPAGMYKILPKEEGCLSAIEVSDSAGINVFFEVLNDITVDEYERKSQCLTEFKEGYHIKVLGDIELIKLIEE